MDLIYGWDDNFKNGSINFVDETIRDGMQGIDSKYVTIEVKKHFIDFMINMNSISDVVVGMISSFEESNNEILKLISYISEKASLFPWILCRTNEEDISRAVKLSKEHNLSFGMNLFMSFSDIRMFVEDWNLDENLSIMASLVTKYKGFFPKIRVAIEDATRTSPEKLVKVISRLLELDIDRIVIADTAGVATPRSVLNMFTYLRDSVPDFMKTRTEFEWHGHNDRGLAVANSITSYECGVRYIHGTMLGVGERNGNAALDTLLCNFYNVLGESTDWDVLKKYLEYSYPYLKTSLEQQHPFFGANSQCSATGTHCAALFKAIKKGRTDLARYLYYPISPYPKDVTEMLFISPLSGNKNIELVCYLTGMDFTIEDANTLLQHVKKKNLILSFEEAVQFLKKIRG